MPQYLVGVFHGDERRSTPPAEMAAIHEAVGAVNQKAIDDGIFVFAGGLHPSSASTTVNPHSGTPVVTDGPFLETKEYLGGFWIIEVADLDAALAWAKTAALACQDTLEVRPFMEMPDGVE